MIRHYVKFSLQGAYVNEDTTPIEIAIRDIKRIKIPKNILCVELFDRLNGKKQNIEKYYVGKFSPISTFEENSFAHLELINNDCKGIVTCNGGNVFKIKNNETIHMLTQNEIDENNKNLDNLLPSYDEEKE